MATIKPTHKDPISPQSEKFEKNFNKTMITTAPGIRLNEVDGLLTEKEQSLKKKIWSLAKMEALVFSDPKLSAVYEEMAENGEEKYGYHYNETIQNMIFNDYVLNSPQYLQKYKMAIPKEKKRRDKSGINQLKKAGAAKMDATGTKIQKNEPQDVEESTTAGSAGGAAGYTGYAGPSAWSSTGDLSGDFKGKKKKKETDPKAKPISTGFALHETNYLIDPSGFEKIFNELNESSSSSGGSGEAFESPLGFRDDVKNISKELDTVAELKDLDTVRVSLPGQEKRAYGKSLPSGQNVSSAIAKPVINKAVKKPYYPGGEITSPFLKGQIKVNQLKELAKSETEPQVLKEESKSKSQQRFMGMVHAVQKGELSPDEVGSSVAKAADSMSDKDAEDFASTKHKGLPEKVKEFNIKENNNIKEETTMNNYIVTVQHDGGQKRIKTTASDRNAAIQKIMSAENAPENAITNVIEEPLKEETQSIIQDNGTSMSNKPQPIGDQGNEVPMGAQETGGLNEDLKLLEEINNELTAFSVHHKKLKLMAEDKKTPSMIQGDRLRSENPKNFKKDLQHSGTKEIIDVEKELQWKDQQTDVPKDPQKLGLDIEKAEIKTADMKGDEALKNVGDSTNRDGDEIPKRNLTTKEQEEVDLYRNGQHSLNFDNEPGERFIERQKADQGKFFEIGEKQKKFKADAPMYNKDTQPIDDGIEKVQFDKNVKSKGDKVAWNQRMGLGSNIKLSESMITGRYINALNKRALLEFNLNEVGELSEGVRAKNEIKAEDLFELDFTGLGNKYLNKSVNKKVLVNEVVATAMDSHKFYTDGKVVFAMKNPVQSLNEGEVKKKPVISEQEKKMKHLLGYKPQDFVSTKNITL